MNTLERDGLVTRNAVAGDKRLVRVELTERGQAEPREGMRAQARRERLWFDALDPAEQRRLAALLARLADQDGPPRPA